MADRLWPWRGFALMGLACVAVVASTLLTLEAQALQARVPVGPPDSGWVVETARATAHVKIAPFLGREAVWLKNNAHAIRTGVDFSDGTIEFDLAPTDDGDFAAVVFRRTSFQDHENIYLRLRRSDFMAMQYAPRVNGSSTWQLYREFSVDSAWPRNQWTHIRVEVRGSLLEIFVGNAITPTLSVPRLRNGTTHGEVAFWARANDKPDAWAAAIANLQIRPAPSATPLVPARDAPPEFVQGWEVAGPTSATGAMTSLPGAQTWTRVRAEESGLVNLNRLFPVQKGRSVAYARKLFRSETVRRIPAGIGYSDDVTVFVNGEPVYSGVNGWDSRTPQFASFVDTRFETVWLPVRAGDNELILAVSDDQRFGWGFAARFDDRAGLFFLNPQ